MATAKKKTGKRLAQKSTKEAPAPTRTPSFWTELYERGLDLATGVAMGAKLASGGGMHDIIEIGKERLRFRR
jgi:hypothetical protein